MLNGYIGVKYVDGAHWYITYLVLFDIIVAIISWIEQKFRINRKYLLIIWIIANILLQIFSIYYRPLEKLYQLLGGKYIALLIIGISLKELMNNSKKITNKKSYIFLLLCSSTIILSTEKLITVIGILIILGIFLLAIKEKIKIFNNKNIYSLGNISYVIYIIHQNIGYQMILAMTNIFGGYSTIYIFIVSVVILLISTIIYKFYEQSLNKVIKNKIDKIKFFNIMEEGKS